MKLNEVVEKLTILIDQYGINLIILKKISFGWQYKNQENVNDYRKLEQMTPKYKTPLSCKHCHHDAVYILYGAPVCEDHYLQNLSMEFQKLQNQITLEQEGRQIL